MNTRKKIQQKAAEDLSIHSSPLNPVKFELGIIIAVTILLWIAVHLSINDPITQISVLFVFSILTAAWIVFRIKYLLQRISRKHISN